MDEEPEVGIRRDSIGTHGLVGRETGGGPGRTHRTTPRTLRRSQRGRASRSTRRRVRDGLRASQRQLDLQIHRHGTPGSLLPPRPCTAGPGRRAGDAAHVHPPHGGQGLNTGVQDAVNLGWSLAQVVNKTSPESLLDTYHAERHPVGARVLHNTMAQVALNSGGDRHQALRDTMTELLSMESRAGASPRCSPVSISTTTSERNTRWLGGACPTSTCRRRTVPRASSPCCTTPGPCSSTSVNPAVSTFLLGRIESGWSTPSMLACGSSRSLARPLLPGRVDPTRRTCRLA